MQAGIRRVHGVIGPQDRSGSKPELRVVQPRGSRADDVGRVIEPLAGRTGRAGGVDMQLDSRRAGSSDVSLRDE